MLKYQQTFGYTREDLETIIAPMALDAKEPIGSMGVDVPLAVLSDQPQHLSSYFKQFFAQVTNPPIDPIRERLVMSLATFIGNNGNILDEDPRHCHCVAAKQPILSNRELEKLRSIDTGSFQAKNPANVFQGRWASRAPWRGAWSAWCRYSEDAVNDGFEVLILSDRAMDSEHAPIPSLLAVSAVHHHLIKKGMRGSVGLVVEAGETCGKCIILPACCRSGPPPSTRIWRWPPSRRATRPGWLGAELPAEKLAYNYIKAVCDGLLKIFSKMGISTLQSYHGAQVFEILGLNQSVVDQYFNGAVTRIQGLGLDEIAKETLYKHSHGFKQETTVGPELLDAGGVYQWRRKGEAPHV